MYHWTKRLFAIAAPLLLTSCLWGPGKFTSDLTLRKDGSFTLDYRGEIVLQIPNDNPPGKIPLVWHDSMLHCFSDGHVEQDRAVMMEAQPNGSMKTIPLPKKPNERSCTAAELSKARSDFDKSQAELAAKVQQDREQTAKLFGLPGLDDASNRAFAAKLMKYAGWRSVTYCGNGVFDVDYHMEGRAT